MFLCARKTFSLLRLVPLRVLCWSAVRASLPLCCRFSAVCVRPRLCSALASALPCVGDRSCGVGKARGRARKQGPSICPPLPHSRSAVSRALVQNAIAQHAHTLLSHRCPHPVSVPRAFLPSHSVAQMSDPVDLDASVLQLSDPDPTQQQRAADRLALALQQGSISAAQLVAIDAIPPLLLILQQSHDEDATTAASASVRSALSASSSCGSSVSLVLRAVRRLLHQLQVDSKLRLFDAGWNVENTASGGVEYRCAATKETRRAPPALPAPIGDDAHEAEWIGSMLAELPLLCQPLRNKDESGEVIWAARVRMHRPRTATEPSMSVIDVRPEIESAAGAVGGAKHSAGAGDVGDSADGVSRQLIIGCWQGIGCAFRETETDLSYPPGSHLEAWYTVTLAGVGLMAVADPEATTVPAAGVSSSSAASVASSPPSALPSKRMLVIGLGGGALVSFLAHHAPHLAIDVVELSKSVAQVAEQWFGVRFKRSISNAGDGENGATLTLPDLAVQAGFAAPSSGAPCELHVMDALEFVRDAKPGSFDLILLDVYTSAVFPPSLLHADFFRQLRRMLTKRRSAVFAGTEPEVGTLLVNAGVGADREMVAKCADEAFGENYCRMLLDRRTAAPAAAASAASSSSAAASSASVDSESSQENGVLLAGSIVPHFRDRLNVVAWRKRVVERQPADVPPLPFELASILTEDLSDESQDGAGSGTSAPTRQPRSHVAWRGVAFDKIAERQRKQRLLQEEQRKAGAARRTIAAQESLSSGSVCDHCCEEHDRSHSPRACGPKMASKNDAMWSLFD